VPASHYAISQFLARLQMSTALSLQEQQAVLSLSWTEVEHQAHSQIAHPGDTVDRASLVAWGMVARFNIMRSGERGIAALYLPGDMADLHSVVVPTISWGLTALRKTTILHIPHRQLQDIASTYPNLALAFWRDTAIDASILARWVVNIGRKDALARVAHLLCELGLRFERAGHGRRCNYAISLTQAQVADATGLTAVHVNRIFKALKDEGLVSLQDKNLAIHDWDKLAHTAEFSRGYLLALGGNDPNS
jgi:CRP-like cAMP-binding protein